MLMDAIGQTRSAPFPVAIAISLEHAAGAVARLDSALSGHPLATAWSWRARLEAIRRQAAVDGQAIDPWHLAALIEGVRFRLGSVDQAGAAAGPRPRLRAGGALAARLTEKEALRHGSAVAGGRADHDDL